MRVISIPCPHCLSRVRATKSRTMSNMFKEITYMCQNDECGHVFIAGLEVLRTVSLSAIPAGDVRIPVSQHARNAARQQLALDLAAA